VVQVLTRLVKCHGQPAQLRTDNGPGFSSARLSEWFRQQGVTLHWIQPGKLTQNAYIERSNGSFRRELLDAHLFRSLTPRAPTRGRVDARLQYPTAPPGVKFYDPTRVQTSCLISAYYWLTEWGSVYIHRALELGVTHLDTADIYGPFTN